MALNYDFGANWEKKVLPKLQSTTMQEAIKACIREIYKKVKNAYVENGLSKKKWKFPKPESSTFLGEYSNFMVKGYGEIQELEYWYTVKFCWAQIQLEKQLKNDAPAKWRKYDKRLCKSGGADDHSYRKREEIEDKLRDEYMSNTLLSNQIFSYIPFGHEDIWAKHVGIHLAKLLLPSENWKLKDLDDGRIVIVNERDNRLCDIVEWARHGGLYNYMLGSIDVLPEDASGIYYDFSTLYDMVVQYKSTSVDELKGPFRFIDSSDEEN